MPQVSNLCKIEVAQVSNLCMKRLALAESPVGRASSPPKGERQRDATRCARHAGQTRRGFLASLAAGAAIAVPASGFIETSARRAIVRATRSPAPIVLYSSVDDAFLREIVALFHNQHDERCEIKLVGDTEATKTTGLVQRLIAEKDAPRADVWWSSEALGTAMLAREGVLAPHRPAAIERDLPEGTEWPKELAHERWTGFACRARVIVVNTKRVPEGERPARLRDLTEPQWRGRIGIARPQFGTTRGQFAALLAEHGEAAFSAWLQGLKANAVKLFDGNATVIRACASGEIDVGLTDTDDVWAGMARGWPVTMVFEAREQEVGEGGRPNETPHPGPLPQGEREQKRPGAEGEARESLASIGPLLIPNTIGLVAGGPNPDGGRALIEFLLGAEVERALTRSESKNLPMRPGLLAEYPDTRVPGAWGVDWATALEAMPKALEMVEEALR